MKNTIRDKDVVNQELDRQIFLDSHKQCDYCGSPLNFKYHKKKQTNHIIESSQCTGCGIQSKWRKFKLQ